MNTTIAQTVPEGADKTQDRAGVIMMVIAGVGLVALAAGMGYVSYRAQYNFIHGVKGEKVASALEALGLDVAAIVFAALALAQALLGKPALIARALNVSCVAGSLAMNAMSADFGDPKSVAVWVLPPTLYALVSDRLIAVVRDRVVARRKDATEDTSPLAVIGRVLLYGMRLVLAPPSTVAGLRRWVLGRTPIPLADGEWSALVSALPDAPLSAPESASTGAPGVRPRVRLERVSERTSSASGSAHGSASRRALGSASPGAPGVHPAKVRKVAQANDRSIADKGRTISVRAAMREGHVSADKAKQILATLGIDPGTPVLHAVGE